MNFELILAAIMGIGLLITFFVIIQYFQIWLRCLLSGAPVQFPLLVAMKIRNVPVARLADAYICCVKAGVEIDMAELETEYLAAPDDFDLYVKERVKIHREESVNKSEQDNPITRP